MKTIQGNIEVEIWKTKSAAPLSAQKIKQVPGR